MTTQNVQLVSAIFADDPSKIKFLVEQGMDVNDQKYNNPKIVEILLQHETFR